MVDLAMWNKQDRCPHGCHCVAEMMDRRAGLIGNLQSRLQVRQCFLDLSQGNTLAPDLCALPCQSEYGLISLSPGHKWKYASRIIELAVQTEYPLTPTDVMTRH